MGLPQIAPYALPTREELPVTRAPWKVDRNRVALLIHDLQNYFVKPFTANTSPIQPAIENIQRLRQHCRKLEIPVIFSAQPGKQNLLERGLQADIWGPGMSDAPEDQAIIDDLNPDSSEIILTKWRYSAFQRTNLEPMLHRRKRDQLIITGIYAHIGCLLTAADAFMRDVEPFLVADAMASFSRDQHDQSISYGAANFAVPVTTDILLEALSEERGVS